MGTRFLARLAFSLAIVVGLLLGSRTTLAQESTPKSSSLPADIAGTWLISASLSCEPNDANAEVCDGLLGNWTSFLNPMVATVSADGTFTFLATYSLTAADEGGASACGVAVFNDPFNGICRVADHGSGHIEAGATGELDFWVDTETATFFAPDGTTNESEVVNPIGDDAYPLDTALPAVPGAYDTGDYLTMLGFSKAPAGVIARVVVSHFAE